MVHAFSDTNSPILASSSSAIFWFFFGIELGDGRDRVGVNRCCAVLCSFEGCEGAPSVNEVQFVSKSNRNAQSSPRQTSLRSVLLYISHPPRTGPQRAAPSSPAGCPSCHTRPVLFPRCPSATAASAAMRARPWPTTHSHQSQCCCPFWSERWAATPGSGSCPTWSVPPCWPRSSRLSPAHRTM